MVAKRIAKSDIIIMSLTSSNSNRNSTKLRIVFLGDQGVGKSSIIDRYTTNRFDEAHNVQDSPLRIQLGSILTSKILPDTVRCSDFKCGTLQDKSATEA